MVMSALVRPSYADNDINNPLLPKVVRQLLAMSGDDYSVERAERIALNWRYYKNTQYEREFLGLVSDPAAYVAATRNADMRGAALQRGKALWDGVKPLFSLCTRAVNDDKRLCFKRARPLPSKPNSTLEKRLTEKWEQEHFARKIRRSPLYGAIMGDSYLRVITPDLSGNPQARSRLKVYSPELMTVLWDQHDDDRMLAAKIEYQFIDEASPNNDIVGGLGQYYGVTTEVNGALGLAPSQQVYTYTMIITEEAYYTFRDFKLHKYSTRLGNSWPNKLGVVPVVHVPFGDIGEVEGVPTFEPIKDTLDSVNVLLSMYGQVLKMHADPILLFYGVQPDDIVKTTTASGSTVIYIPLPVQFGGTNPTTKPSVEFLEWKGASTGPLLEYVRMIKDDCERALPESQLWHSSSAEGNGSGYGKVVDMQEGVNKHEEIREWHHEGAEDALQMALVADDAKNETLKPDVARARIEAARRDYDLTFYVDPVLPRDVATLTQVVNTQIADKTLSRYGGMLMMGKTYLEADAEVERINKERQEDLEWAEKMAKAQAAANPLPQGGGNTPQVRSNMPNGRRSDGKNQGTPPTTPSNQARKAGQPGTRQNNPKP